jgi:hypothetical protein
VVPLASGGAGHAFAGTCDGTGTGDFPARTAYAWLTQIQSPQCAVKAAALCADGAWYPATAWKRLGAVPHSSKTCPNNMQMTNNGWYIQLVP